MSKRRKPASRRPGASTAKDKPALPDEPFFLACVDMIGRTGPKTLEFRWSPPEIENTPTVWIAVAGYEVREKWAFVSECAFAVETATFRLLERLVDGGQCQQCSKPTGVTREFHRMPIPEEICWYQFDPELKTFRRGCE